MTAETNRKWTCCIRGDTARGYLAQRGGEREAGLLTLAYLLEK